MFLRANKNAAPKGVRTKAAAHVGYHLHAEIVTLNSKTHSSLSPQTHMESSNAAHINHNPLTAGLHGVPYWFSFFGGLGFRAQVSYLVFPNQPSLYHPCPRFMIRVILNPLQPGNLVSSPRRA